MHPNAMQAGAMHVGGAHGGEPGSGVKSVVAALLVCLAGFFAFYGQTEGFMVLTTEAARRVDIARVPRMLPDAPLVGQDGAQTALRRVLGDDGRIAVVNFMYTRCVSICLAMGAEFQQLQQAIAERGWGDRVRLLSLSFDPADTPEYLRRYAQTRHADPALWRTATLAPGVRRQALLDAFGIIVVPASYGQYEHNAAYHVVHPDGHLVRVMDIGDPDGLIAYLNSAIRVTRDGGSAIGGPVPDRKRFAGDGESTESAVGNTMIKTEIAPTETAKAETPRWRIRAAGGDR
jgi:protein SCO1/2